MVTACQTDYATCKLPTTFDLAALLRSHPSRYPYLLESVAQGSLQSRYSILFAFPGEQLMLDAAGVCRDGTGVRFEGGFLELLDSQWQHARMDNPTAQDALPFRGGWFLYLGYELAAQIEPSLKLPGGDLPVAWATRIPAAVVVDHVENTTTLVAETEQSELLNELHTDVQATRQLPEATRTLLAGPLTEEAPELYLDAVQRARQYILDGDIFQANLSRRWQAGLKPGITAFDVYRRLRHANPAPFAGLVCHERHAIISSSPERLVSVRGKRIEARPIAGTRPRSADAERDAALIRELIAHPKERAEHVMLLDLVRNDLGRVACTGSVQVDELMIVESYAHVHHIVSNVCGQLRAATTPGEVIRAVFPGGTITGCPKVRCMEIIAELEQVPRGAYTGSMGYLNRDGDMDLNILIRTLIQQGPQLEFRTGAGIVADSIPERELEETRAKARGLTRALDASP